MPVSTKIVKRRIKSIQSTRKITKAMELVAASKMRRAVNAVLSTRPYSGLSWDIIAELAQVTEQGLHSLLRVSDEVKKVLVIAVASDRGLCGGFNAQMGRKVTEFMKKLHNPSQPPLTLRGGDVVDNAPPLRVRGGEGELRVEFVTIGKKITDLAKGLKWNLIATFTNLSNNPAIVDVRPVAQLAMNDFISAKYDRVYLAYTDFESSVKQTPYIHQLLPITKDRVLGAVRTTPNPSSERRGNDSIYNYEYKFEPTPQEVLDLMLPRLVEVQIYQAILESSASEHAARMVAMKNASDAANDMIDDLTFTFNQARQSAITREISEISAGKAAIE